jgi:protein-disulfide isomerase
MDQPTSQSNLFRNVIYIVAALAGAGLIVYGAFFYTQKAKNNPQAAQVLPQTQNNDSQQQQAAPETTANFAEPFLGQADAPVTMIEYGSYLCGHCINFGRNTFPQIEQNYINIGKVKFIYRSYPPLELGMAALCANDQGKFWDYHKYALNNDIKSEDDLKKFAAAVSLNQDEFNKCLDDKKYNDQATAWYQMGQDAKVEGTPTFFINNKQIVGDLPYADFQKAIDEALQGK